MQFILEGRGTGDGMALGFADGWTNW